LLNESKKTTNLIVIYPLFKATNQKTTHHIVTIFDKIV